MAKSYDELALPMTLRTFVNQNRNAVLARSVALAASSRERRRGLLGISNLAESSGLWILPCEAIHTFGMKMAIDSIFLDKQLRVRSVRHHLQPNRIAICLSAHSVLELPAGSVARSETAVGDQLAMWTLKGGA